MTPTGIMDQLGELFASVPFVEVMVAYSNTLDELKRLQTVILHLEANGALEDEPDLGSDLSTVGILNQWSEGSAVDFAANHSEMQLDVYYGSRS